MIQKTYPTTVDPEGLAQKLVQTFQAQGYEVQKLNSGGDIYVQIRKAGILRTVTGLSQALTVHIQKTNEGTVVSLGQGRWADKAIVEAAGFFFFTPLMIPASWGLYEQHKLPGKILKVIDEYAASVGASHIDQKIVEVIHCPHCGVTNVAGAKFCSACGSPL
ncbi:hypothetical protein B9Q11_04670 [Candidatus Marsarchaeota G2 archaeon ECH_B_SAG-F08]|jgi:hypothetical protein|uniref:DUF7577 domain-containing protein n=3 Tax=Candidatus Marsarchaeota TaxID=1978152 RepID=A0A2R6C0D6_9ARCH|nr:MAG: hypothetical protein B9Q02_07785 [Candidatus Marsarchaeota G1 archaeon BE_D]PSN97200.1 MAG: hypothetical protein B9Q11_04670 [Candidatus Marsarchaeota G2 archaeon ECH_B_SAG-F08]PSO04345.1 MAG: hypothetical protein B9Q12_02635 [Candidatus Marsarchaeota G2 archaeon ECH_B_SAG-G06]